MERQYFLVVEGEKQGPLVRDELIDAGMHDDSLIWFEGCTCWVRAGLIPDLIELLKEERKAKKKLRKEKKIVAKLPAPTTFNWLARVILFVHIPGALLYLLSTLALIVAFIAWLCIGEDGPRPGDLAPRIVSVAGIGGLATFGLAALVLLAEAVLLAIFIANGRRIVAAISPDAKEPNLVLEMLSGISTGLPGVPDVEIGAPMAHTPYPFAYLGMFVFAVLILFVLLFVMFWLALILLVTLFALLVLGTVSIILVNTIPKLADGLNRVIEEDTVETPRISRRLSFWTALSTLLLAFGPFGVPAFVLVPIWLFKTSDAAMQICAQRRSAVAVPALEPLSGGR
jgi:hypothetical protein